MQKRTGVPWGTVPMMLIEFHRYSLHFTSIPTNCDCQPRVTPPRGKESQWYTNEMTIKHIEFCRFPSMLLTQSKASAHTKLFQASMHSTAACVYIYISIPSKCPQSCHLTVPCSVQSARRMFSGFLSKDWVKAVQQDIPSIGALTLCKCGDSHLELKLHILPPVIQNRT